ncbi:hypothetical protein CH63R_03988 [Colletotrichum higginsianum IMI 349063]|uniref:Uncharacterized protein n=1 Tax=Colletotrichum higginsianum (strain IMI 349063) TaxID=759273 RepID=A0A1B7YIA2_COLHI|nr:hypothetical protein CH63R_03988 [Colletotrichum higginsianum IMI 349063]OBR11692.1 hypothetical protein CH63R_03988 [Colletotrichum higginsianum IMI 349063]
MSVRRTSFNTARVVTAFTLSRRAPSGGLPHDSDARPADLKVESARGVWRGDRRAGNICGNQGRARSDLHGPRTSPARDGVDKRPIKTERTRKSSQTGQLSFPRQEPLDRYPSKPKFRATPVSAAHAQQPKKHVG